MLVQQKERSDEDKKFNISTRAAFMCAVPPCIYCDGCVYLPLVPTSSEWFMPRLNQPISKENCFLLFKF